MSESQPIPELEAVEGLLREWQSLRASALPDSGAAEVVLRHPERLAQSLASLRVGAAPAGLDETVSRAWQPFVEAWASPSTLTELAKALQSVEAGFRPSEDELATVRREIELRQERVEALETVLAILDELVSGVGTDSRHPPSDEQPESGQSPPGGSP